MQFKCKRCGQEHTLTVEMLKSSTWTAQFAAQWKGTGYQDLKRQPPPDRVHHAPAVPQPGAYVETPIHQQTMESGVKVPLATSLISGSFTGVLVLCGWQFVGWAQPVTATVAATIATTWWKWQGGVDFARGLLTRVEDFTGMDWNQDGQVGSTPAQGEPVLSPFPVRVADDDKAAESTAVETAPTRPLTRAEQPILIRKAEENRPARVVTLGEIWDFLLTSFSEHDDKGWSRAAWGKRGMSRDAWEDHKSFFEKLNPEWWKTIHPPTLDLVLRRFGAPNTRPPEVPPARPTENEG